MYCNMNHMLREAERTGTGVGAFNIHCLEVVPGMIRVYFTIFPRYGSVI